MIPSFSFCLGISICFMFFENDLLHNCLSSTKFTCSLSFFIKWFIFYFGYLFIFFDNHFGSSEVGWEFTLVQHDFKKLKFVDS